MSKRGNIKLAHRLNALQVNIDNRLIQIPASVFMNENLDGEYVYIKRQNGVYHYSRNHCIWTPIQDITQYILEKQGDFMFCNGMPVQKYFVRRK